MQVHFTKMQGAGNDFVVLDETRFLLGLTQRQYQMLADRHFGVGADQILSVRPAPTPQVDFEYVIHNADGREVEHCGNGARCFYQFVQEHGLARSPVLKVQTVNRVLTLQRNLLGEVRVDMGGPVFEEPRVPFVTQGLNPQKVHLARRWLLEMPGAQAAVPVSVASMGNPHVLVLVPGVEHARVEVMGPEIGSHGRFPQGVNVGFMEVLSRDHVRLRVYERGVGETLACGTGACAAVAMGVQLGLLSGQVRVDALGGTLGVDWSGGESNLYLSGPAVTVFSGDIKLPD
jgi:diaminopimelate epimerase